APASTRKRTRYLPYACLTAGALDIPPDTHRLPNRGSRYVRSSAIPWRTTTCEGSHQPPGSPPGCPSYVPQLALSSDDVLKSSAKIRCQPGISPLGIGAVDGPLDSRVSRRTAAVAITTASAAAHITA